MPLLERAGRGVRLTDAALVLVEPRRGAARARRARRGRAGRGRGQRRRARRGSPPSSPWRCGSPSPAMQALAREAPGLRCELVEAEPEQSLPALALGDVDLVLADEWQHQPRARPAGVDREDLHQRPGPPRPARRPSGRAAPPRRGAAGRARRRGLDHRPPGHGLGGGDEPDLPRARRLRPRHPPPHQRQRHQPGARRPRPGGDAAARAGAPRRRSPASPCGRSPRARSTARSSPPPAPRMPSGPPSGRSWRRPQRRIRHTAAMSEAEDFQRDGAVRRPRAARRGRGRAAARGRRAEPGGPERARDRGRGREQRRPLLRGLPQLGRHRRPTRRSSAARGSARSPPS